MDHAQIFASGRDTNHGTMSAGPQLYLNLHRYSLNTYRTPLIRIMTNSEVAEFYALLLREES